MGSPTIEIIGLYNRSFIEGPIAIVDNFIDKMFLEEMRYHQQCISEAYSLYREHVQVLHERHRDRVAQLRKEKYEKGLHKG
jgi:hypothetical protein